MDMANAQGAAFTLPYLCIHGSEDRMCLPIGSEEWHSKTSTSDKTRLVVEGAYHELHNEMPQYREQWSKAVLGWIDKHRAPPALPSIM